jgi:adenylosuccinate synthase
MKLAVVGLQWGVAGKGKVVDFLAKDFDVNARYQGGSNAGHTVRIGNEQIIFHQIPCGILHKNVIGVIGAGCVFDPAVFFDELKNLKNYDRHIEQRIKISKYCHLIFPYHILIDTVREDTKQRLGTTKKGIGVAYEDKYARVGLRIGDLFDRELFEKKLRMNISRKNLILMEIYHAEPLSEGEIFTTYMDYAKHLEHMVTDDSVLLCDTLRSNKSIIFEGAQGALLDVDFGTYPYVTSSHTIASGAGIGLGIPPHVVDEVIGVAKA